MCVMHDQEDCYARPAADIRDPSALEYLTPIHVCTSQTSNPGNLSLARGGPAGCIRRRATQVIQQEGSPLPLTCRSSLPWEVCCGPGPWPSLATLRRWFMAWRVILGRLVVKCTSSRRDSPLSRGKDILLRGCCSSGSLSTAAQSLS